MRHKLTERTKIEPPQQTGWSAPLLLACNNVRFSCASRRNYDIFFILYELHVIFFTRTFRRGNNGPMNFEAMRDDCKKVDLKPDISIV